MSKLPARRIGRSRETQTKKFDQAVSEFVTTVFENNRRDFIRTVSLPRIKARAGLEIFIPRRIRIVLPQVLPLSRVEKPEAPQLRLILMLHWSDRTGNRNKIVIRGAQWRGKLNRVS